MIENQHVYPEIVPERVKIVERIDQLTFIQRYNQLETVFGLLEQIKAKYTKSYIPAGVKYYYRE